MARTIEEITCLVLDIFKQNKERLLSISFLKRKTETDYYTLTKILKKMYDEKQIDVIQTTSGKFFKFVR